MFSVRKVKVCEVRSRYYVYTVFCMHNKTYAQYLPPDENPVILIQGTVRYSAFLTRISRPPYYEGNGSALRPC